jgi:hypothetical protein
MWTERTFVQNCYGPSGSHKSGEIWAAKQLLFSQGLCSMGLVHYNMCQWSLVSIFGITFDFRIHLLYAGQDGLHILFSVHYTVLMSTSN